MNHYPSNPFSRKHGSLYDRGSADKYYGRPRDPHWWPEGTDVGERVPAKTEAERAEYNRGYDDEDDKK